MSEQLWAVRVVSMDEEFAARSFKEAKRQAEYANNVFKNHELWAGAEVVEYSGDEEDHAKDILWKTIYPQISEQALFDEKFKGNERQWNNFFAKMFLNDRLAGIPTDKGKIKVVLALDEYKDFIKKVEQYAKANLKVTFYW